MSAPLGVLFAGVGAVASTAIAGVYAARRGLAPPVGCLTELASTSDGRPWRTGLASFDDLRFAGWDVHGRDVAEVARASRVLDPTLVAALSDELASVPLLAGTFSPEWVPGLPVVAAAPTSSPDAAVDRLRDEIRMLRDRLGVERCVVVWCGSTEAWPDAVDGRTGPVPPSVLYARAALQEGAAFATAAPSGGVELPSIQSLAVACGVPVAGRDLKTGQTLLKAALAGLLRDRMLGVDGWFSLNLLGNQDGRVLAEPGPFAAKAKTKGRALDAILDGEAFPSLYGDLQHEIRIEHYRPRGDDKEAWDTIDLFGWMGARMQLKVDWLGRDSILAAPLVIDLARLLDLAHRRGRSGVQGWLGYYFKDPIESDGPQQHRVEAQRSRLDAAVAELLG